jgi:hypothetical protein
MTAPLARFWLTASEGCIPVCCAAQFLHARSSDWNTSKGFPGPGITITLGPVGMVAQPPRAAAARSKTRAFPRFIFLTPYYLGGAGCGSTFIQPPGHSLT